MKLPVLFRRRSLVLPTFTGVILILFLLFAALYLIIQNMAVFLAVNEPVDADYLVIEGWLGKKELKQAYQVFGERNYKFAIVSGGPISDDFNAGPKSYAERAKNYLQLVGFTEEKLFAVPAPFSAQERTFLSAVMVRDWFANQGIVVKSLDVFSADVHSRRSRDLYQLAFGDGVDIGVYASRPDEFDLSRWWQSSNAAKSVLVEFLGWLYVKCCFNPGKPGSHYEKWGIDK